MRATCRAAAAAVATLLLGPACSTHRDPEPAPLPPVSSAPPPETPPVPRPEPAPPPPPAPPRVEPEEVASGIASWYGPGFHGKTTASGERYDQDELTAAHPSLPFGALVRVTLLETGRSVVVRITDRGPTTGKIIDVSRAAARALGLIEPGTGEVRLEVLRDAAPR